jgi:hypothetical protein
MAQLSPKEREIEELKAKLTGLETKLAGLESSGTTEDVLVGLRNQIAAKETRLTQLEGQAAGGGEPLDLTLVVFFSLKTNPSDCLEWGIL